jgi:hypothetical protein
MSIGIIIMAVVLITIFALFSKKSTEDDKNDNDFEEKIDVDESDKMIEQFFDEVNNGEEKIKFLKIDNQFDLMFIKSLFQSEGIPYYVEYENISRIRPGMYVGDLGNYNLVSILDKDYTDAFEVVKNYIESKRNSKKNDENKMENARNLAEILIGNWKVPSAEETNGIQIIYKK